MGLVLPSLLAGCGEVPKIEQYQAPKVVRAAARPAASVPTRLIGAIIPQQNEVWFLKLTAADAPAQALADPIRSIAASFRFDAAGQPSWTLPEGWQELPGDSIRYKTLRTTHEGGTLDVSVTMLAFPGGDLDEYVLANVNRWRGQVGLEPLASDQLATQVEKLTAAGSPVYYCNYLGRGAGAPGPMAPGAASAAAAAPPATAPAGNPAEPNEMVGTVPPGWQATAGNALSAAAFQVMSGDGSQRAEITVTSLGAAAGNVLDNVNRWRGQIELGPLTAEELGQQQKSLTIGGSEAPYFVVTGSPAAANPETILGVIVPRGGSVWFVKLRGPTALAEQERENFESFARGLRLP